jgi:hypothetical protein
MTEQQQALRRLETTRKSMQEWLSKPIEQRRKDLQAAGILDRHGHLSSRYGGPGEMTDKAP